MRKFIISHLNIHLTITSHFDCLSLLQKLTMTSICLTMTCKLLLSDAINFQAHLEFIVAEKLQVKWLAQIEYSFITESLLARRVHY